MNGYGDCIEHATHHYITDGCWGAIKAWLYRERQKNPDWTHREIESRYQFAYESRATEHLIRTEGDKNAAAQAVREEVRNTQEPVPD